ncbi:metal ABC transporter ATP-binding protein [bacterium]|nr:metal ABC transporter ATP-binding protein [bacterium]
MSADAILSLDGVTVRAGRVAIVRDVDMRVRRGSIHALVGPNGAGKTTLLRAIFRGVPHDGRIAMRFARDGRVGYVPQRVEVPDALPMTVADFFQIALGPRPPFLGLPRASRLAIEAALARLNATHLFARRMRDLSGGEMRRVLVAHALCPAPELLILDEPATHLDLPGTRLVHELLRELRDRDGVSILMVAHDTGAVARLADDATGLDETVRFVGPASRLAEAETLRAIYGAEGHHAPVTVDAP